MSKTHLLVTTFIVALLALTFSGTGIIQAAEEGGPVAVEYYGPEGIQFYPIVSYKTLIVSISFPNGQVVKRTFEAGKDPYISLGEYYGAKFTDGSYTFQLRAIFGAEPQEELRDPKWEGIYMQDSLLQSGYFQIERGSIVDRVEEEEGQKAKFAKENKSPKKGPGNLSGSTEELSTTQDVCYNDDLIVDGSLCVGFDCTCNYSFGFDTIVLKENNLRIFFDDTSVAASYPRNDWRIVINDSANGGAAYFGVEDSTGGRRVFTLEAGAPSHSLFVDDGGRVGFGTSTPSVELHTVDGDTPTLRLQQDGSSGFAPQTWDVAGNETNFFIRDVTNGSQLPFRIQPDTPSNTLTLRADGRIGIGTWSPSFPLHIITANGTNAGVVVSQTGQSEGKFLATSSGVQIGARTDHAVRIMVDNNTAMMTLNTDSSIDFNNGASITAAGVVVDNPSSRALKENISTLSAAEAIDAVSRLEAVKFNYKKDRTENYVGFIAEDVPELVAQKDRKSMIPMDVVAVLTKVVQEQQKAMELQKKNASQQQKTIADLKARLSQLEKQIKK